MREEGCLVCYRPAQAHHLTFVEKDGLRGMRRSGDQHAVPLCDDHHRQLHAHGNEQRWWALQGIDPMAWLDVFKRNIGMRDDSEEEILHDEE